MAAPYDYNNGYTADPINRAPSPYHQQNTSNDYYNQHPQQFDPTVQHEYVLPTSADIVHQPYSDGPTPASEAGPEGERGILGALGGAATGGYVGHQTCHGFLGTVGGAIVGSLTEDWARKKKNCSRPSSRPCSPQPQTCHPPAPVCPPGHPGGHGMYSPPLVHTQTTMSTHTDVNMPPGVEHHQPHYPTHPQPPSYNCHTPPTHPVKPCGHTHTCACKWLGKH